MPSGDGSGLRDLARMYRQTFRRAVRHYGVHPLRAFGPMDQRPIFVVGCPRSGTTFTAGALGSVAGCVDLGEVPRFKNAVPALFHDVAGGQHTRVVQQIRSIISTSQRIAMAGSNRAVEQTPESTFLIPEIAAAFPSARFVHIIRDGRDVAASLLERGWLAADIAKASAGTARRVDDGGQPYGSYARFWVERGHEEEFASSTEAARCGWAWRRYVTFAHSALAALTPKRFVEFRYEELVADPATTGKKLASALDTDERCDELAHALSSVHSRSIGRWTTSISRAQLDDILSQESSLLESLGYIH